jgi:hypothetical protein
MPESYPTFRAGQKVSGALLSSMLSQTVRKLSDTARTSETATDDPELSFEVEANAVYRMRGILYVSADNAESNDDIIIDWTVPASSTGRWGAVGPATNATSDTGSARIIGSSVDASRQFGTDAGGSTSPTTIHVQSLLITSSTAGTYALSWGRGPTAGVAETITVYTDSFLTLQRIA